MPPNVKWNGAPMARRLLYGLHMSLSFPFRVAAALIIFFAALLSTAHAGGSLSQAAFLDAIEDPQIRLFVVEHFQLAEEGRALREGKQSPNAGERRVPYEILARPRAPKAPLLVLRLETLVSPTVVITTCQASWHYAPSCN
jgi:hypothetical protein